MTTGVSDFTQKLTDLRKRVWQLGLPRTLTAEEVKADFGIDIDPSWQMKLWVDEEAEEGFGYSYLTPDMWQIFPDDTLISPEGKSYTRAEYEAEQTLWDEALAAISQYPQLQTAEGLYDVAGLREAGVSEEYIKLLFQEPITTIASTAVSPGEDIFPTTITEEGWEFSNIVWNKETGEPVDYIAISPEGISYTRAELETAQAELELAQAEEERIFGAIEVRATTIGRIFGAVFPEEDVWQTLDWLAESDENQIEFLESIQSIGRTPDTLNLLHNIFPGITTEEIDQILGPTKPWLERLPPEGIDITMEIAGVETLVHVESPNLQVWARNILIGRFNVKGEFHPSEKGLSEYLAEYYIEPPQASKDEIKKTYDARMREIYNTYPKAPYTKEQMAEPFYKEMMDAKAKAWDDYQQALRPPWERFFTAGMGDVVAAASGATRWMEEDGIADRLTEFAEELQIQAPPDYLGEFEWSMMLNPRFYSTRVLRALPFTLSLLPAAIAGGYCGAALAPFVPFLGAYGKLILGSIGAALFSRPLESAFEAGTTYDRAIDKGMTKEQADKAAMDVFLGNLVLGGWDAVQFGIAFLPIPGAETASRFWKLAMVGGKITIVGLTEAGEEAYQEVITRWALDEEVKLDAEMQQVMAIGGIFGIGLGGAGDVFTRTKGYTLENLTPEGRAAFNKNVRDFMGEGLTREQAELRAFDVLAKTEEGGIATSDAIERVKKEEFDREAARYREIIEARVPEVPVMPEPAVEAFLATPDEQILRPSVEVVDALMARGFSKDYITTKMPIPEMKQALAQPIPAVPAVPEVTEITPELQALVNEAQKYKTAGEFISNLRDKVARPKTQAERNLSTAYDKLVKAKLVEQEWRSQLTNFYNQVVKPPAVEVARPPVEVAPPMKVVPTPEEISKTRQTIMSWVKQKGLTQKQSRDIFMEEGEHRQLHLMTPEQLESVLAEVKVSRPVTIKGKRVVTLKTEKKIQTLKDTLIRNKQLTEKSFNHIVEQLNLPTTQYETATKFITETEAKTLIRAMNDEAVLAEWNIKIEEALDKHPDIKTARDAANARSIRTKEVGFDGKPIRIKRGNELRSMRYYVLKLQKELRAPIYDVWQKINTTHLAMRQKQSLLYQKLEDTSTEARQIMMDEVAAKRVEDYIAAKHKMAKFKSPVDITANEISIANELERQLFEFRNDVRYARFTEAYAGHSGDIDMIARDIPDAPKRALRRAIDVFEGRGARALRIFLDTQEWGVIRTGYDPRSIIKPKLHLYPSRATTFSKGHIQTRRGTEYTTEDRSIFQRYRSYTRQMMGLTDLSPLVRAFDRVFTEHAPKLSPGTMRETSKVLSRGLNEMKGYREDGGFIIHALERLYAQVASAVFWRPDLVLRNKFQNFAFNPDYHAGLFLDPRNKAITKQQKLWFEIFVSQQKGMREDYLLYLQKPMPGFGRITNLARKTSLYPWSDKSNRAECFYVRINRINRALARYAKDGNLARLIKDSGLVDFEARQQAEALELLAMDEVDYGIEGLTPVTGVEAFARYNAQQLVNNVHFLYDRAQRAPAEMGAAGKTLGNIMVFSRSWGERLVLQTDKLNPKNKVPRAERIYALRVVVGIIVCGLLAGMTYKEITGKTHNPYNPLNILTWSPGGLIVGVTDDISNVIYLITRAVEGDKSALARLPGVLSGVGTLTLPFYKNLVQALDALTDTKDIDVKAYRKVRELLDDEYEVRGGVHEVERTLLEKIQRALFGLKDEPKTPQEKLAEAEGMLGQTIEEDLPYTIKEPDIYDMKNLNTVMGRNLKDVLLEDITKANDYSELARAWKIKEDGKNIYDRLPNKALYKIDDFEALYYQWQDVKDLPNWEVDYPNANLGNFTKRQLEALRKYHSLEGAEQVEFLEKHPELKLNPASEWLKAHPKENAQLALWGQAKILTLEAYNELNRLIKELDIPDDAIPEFTLPPETSIETHFAYEEFVAEGKHASWEAQLLLLKDAQAAEEAGVESYAEWHDLTLSDTPLRALELKVEHRELFDEYDTLETDEERAKLKADNPEWVDDMRRIEAIEHGGEHIEIGIPSWTLEDIRSFLASDKVNELQYKLRITVEEVEGEKKVAPPFVCRNFTEALIESAIKKGLDLREASITFQNPPRHRISERGWEVWGGHSVAYFEVDGQRFFIEPQSDEIMTEAQLRDYWKEYGIKDIEYGERVLPIGETSDIVEAWVERGNLVDEFTGGSSEALVWLLDNLDVYQWAIDNDLLEDRKEEVLEREPVLRINVRWATEYDKYDGMSDEESDYYIADEDDREKARELMRRDPETGKLTEYGKARYRRDAYNLRGPDDEKFPQAEIENYVAYYEEEAKGYRQERMLLENPDFANAMHTIAGIDLPKAEDVPTVQYDDIYDEWQEQFDELDGLADHKSEHYIENEVLREARRETLRGPDGDRTEFGLAEIRRKGYKVLIGNEKYIENWVEYYSFPDKGIDRERYMLQHVDFYKDVWLGILGNKPIKFYKLPERTAIALLEEQGLLEEWVKIFK